MPCLLTLLALLLPRVLLFFIFVFTHWFAKAYDTLLWPLLGFLFMPYTTLAYMYAMLQNNHHLTNGYIVLVIIAALIDLGAHSKTKPRKRSR